MQHCNSSRNNNFLWDKFLLYPPRITSSNGYRENDKRKTHVVLSCISLWTAKYIINYQNLSHRQHYVSFMKLSKELHRWEVKPSKNGDTGKAGRDGTRGVNFVQNLVLGSENICHLYCTINKHISSFPSQNISSWETFGPHISHDTIWTFQHTIISV